MMFQTQVFPHPQVTSPHLLPDPQVAPPNYPLTPQTQAPPPHLLPHTQVNFSSHLGLSAPPHYELQPQVTPPHLLPPPAQQHLYNQNQHQGLDLDLTWSRPDPPPEPASYLQQNFSFQTQSPSHLDLQTHFREDHSLSYNTHLNTHTLFDSGVYRQVSTPAPLQDAWRPLEPPQPQFQCSSLGPVSGEVPLGGWSSEGNFHHFFPDGYQDHSAPQPFCSPNTPGPSPHYPQTPTISSPGPQMPPREERGDFNTPRNLSTDQNLSCFIHDHESLPLTSDPHQSAAHLQEGHTEPDQDQNILGDAFRVSGNHFSPQDGTRTDAGAGETDWTKMKPLQPEKSLKQLDTRLLCVVCKRDFRSLPALNGHMRSHSGSRSASQLHDSAPQQKPSVSMVMPVSVPVRPRGSAKASGSAQKTRGEGGAALYRSLLQRGRGEGEGEEGGGAHYTPPPMLRPLRAAPGLFCSLSKHRQSDAVATETTGTNQARINVGRSFQAEIPPLQSVTDADSHDALLLWTPLEELERPVCQQRVEALMRMACSSVMPGGGASVEAALQVLSESGGDFLVTMEKLLSNAGNATHTTPGVCWSAAERKLLIKSLQLHHKDFRKIQKTVRTKSLPQCVEFYYQWKKKLSLNAKTPPTLTVALPDTHGQRSQRSHDAL